MYRYVKMVIAIEKNKNESDDKTEQRLREMLVDKGFSVAYVDIDENYNC